MRFEAFNYLNRPLGINFGDFVVELVEFGDAECCGLAFLHGSTPSLPQLVKRSPPLDIGCRQKSISEDGNNVLLE